MGAPPSVASDWSLTVLSDFARLFCGDRLGEGIGREVYALATDPSKVVKVERGEGSFQNVIEWETWGDLKGTRHAKHLAPCHWISPCGIVLIQTRVQPLTPEHEKARLPSFLCDFKRTNYGVLNGRVVCCDYGTNLLLNHGAFASKLAKPRWWD